MEQGPRGSGRGGGWGGGGGEATFRQARLKAEQERCYSAGVWDPGCNRTNAHGTLRAYVM